MTAYNRIFALLVVLVLIVPPAFAGSSERSVNIALREEPPGSDIGICAYYLIEQGETDYFSVYVPPGSSTLFVNLNWFVAQQSLTLEIISPSGSTYAHYHDSDLDGYENAQIRAWISSPEPGNWYFEVYGEDVQNTQNYVFGTSVE